MVDADDSGEFAKPILSDCPQKFLQTMIKIESYIIPIKKKKLQYNGKLLKNDYAVLTSYVL